MNVEDLEPSVTRKRLQTRDLTRRLVLSLLSGAILWAACRWIFGAGSMADLPAAAAVRLVGGPGDGFWATLVFGGGATGCYGAAVFLVWQVGRLAVRQRSRMSPGTHGRHVKSS